ncbi:MAG: hypothetical protein L0Z53_05710 [Acidobacteriales bacterium]|nr:hypothetical protein [Terriglobales bacterium]
MTRSQSKTAVALAICAAAVLCAILWSRPVRSPPVISIDFLGYTNRVGPYAILGITNRSATAVTLDSQCLMHYSTWIELNTLRLTRLRPGEGFVQEVFAFPAGSESQWQFKCYVSRTSTWLDLRRSVELWFEKHIRHAKYPRRSGTWHTFNSEKLDCPP